MAYQQSHLHGWVLAAGVTLTTTHFLQYTLENSKVKGSGRGVEDGSNETERDKTSDERR